MTVDKFRLTKDDSDYTTFPNSLLQGLNNAEALGLYVYLSSLPPTWEFYKEQIQKHFKIGRDKLEKSLKILSSCKLIEIFQERNLKGHFHNWRLHVCNPRSFQPLTDFQGTDQTSVNATSAPFTDLPLTVNQSLDNSSYKRNINKTNKNIKNTKSSLDKKSVDNSKRHSFANSMDQMANEKKHIQEHEKRKQQEIGDNKRTMAIQTLNEIKNNLAKKSKKND